MVERLAVLIRGSKKWPRIAKGSYYFDYNEDHKVPCVIIFAQSGTIGRAGQGWEREDIKLIVWFVEKAFKRTKTNVLYKDYEILRELLHDQKRLGRLSGVQKAVVSGFTQRFGSRGNYILDIMEVSVDVLVNKTY